MSFLSDLFKGNFSNLGNDLAPSNVFSDFGTDAVKTLENPVADAGIALTALTLGAGLPALAGLGAVDATAAGGGALDASLGAAASAGGAAAGTDALGFGGDLSAGTDLSSWLASPTGTSGLSSDTLSLAPTADATGASSAPITLASATNGIQPTLWGDSGADTATLGPGAAGSPLATAAPGAAPGTASTGVWDSIVNALNSPTTKALGTAVGLGGLGYNLFEGYEGKKALNALNQQEATNAASLAGTAAQENAAAQPLLASGNTLQQYLTTGTLPPQFQAQVTQQVQAAKASIIQGYASRGMSTDPNQNSALAQDLANVDLQSQTLQANLESTLATAGGQMIQQANSLLQSGASATEISAQLPLAVQQLNTQLNQQTASAVSAFAASLNGTKPGTISLNLPQNVIGSNGQVNLGG